MRSYTKAFRTKDFTTTTHEIPETAEKELYDKVAILRNASPDQACIYYNELVRPDGTNIAFAWTPTDADGNILFGGRSGLDMANRYFPCLEYQFHPKN